MCQESATPAAAISGDAGSLLADSVHTALCTKEQFSMPCAAFLGRAMPKQVITLLMAEG